MVANLSPIYIYIDFFITKQMMRQKINIINFRISFNICTFRKSV